ncbi:MAG: putative toxin-antitoxin system toxin component, PIN family [bacterium]|nr:putative toxin-antitoxin system toxin component, PIN family [bacterium]MDE0418324.1 putative toxin-antitoxin system toxin component, PIN family [bacterium]
MRVVLDTNILIGALITKGTPPDRLYQAWKRGEIELVTSTAQIAELADVLSRQRLQRFLDADEAMAILENIGTRAVILERLPNVSLSPDPMDNRVLATALAGDADLIVSGDKKHVLALQEVDGIPILTARQALGRVLTWCHET